MKSITRWNYEAYFLFYCALQRGRREPIGDECGALRQTQGACQRRVRSGVVAELTVALELHWKWLPGLDAVRADKGADQPEENLTENNSSRTADLHSWHFYQRELPRDTHLLRVAEWRASGHSGGAPGNGVTFAGKREVRRRQIFVVEKKSLGHRWGLSYR